MIEQFIPDDPDHLEGLSGGNRVYNQVSVNSYVELRIHQAVLVLAFKVSRPFFSTPHVRRSNLSGGIDDLGEECLVFVYNLMAKGVLDGRVVAFDKVAFAVLHGEGGFACDAAVSMTMLIPRSWTWE